ncbi:MAG: hypothetical protein J2P17_29005, partial [Mycobacterium sp.]|nr:hypothetical protein [Mycobacterium sp.]
MCQNTTVPIANRQGVTEILRTSFLRATPDDVERYVQNTLRLLQHDLYLPRPPITRPVLGGVGEHDPLTRPELCRAT